MRLAASRHCPDGATTSCVPSRVSLLAPGFVPTPIAELWGEGWDIQVRFATIAKLKTANHTEEAAG